ncbi:MAG TPA: glycosyltransferase family 39 protein [Kiritimatiellia bacterium]|nr:glycosyltransferase family 39 protein [Kiritimatiellia bacterium]
MDRTNRQSLAWAAFVALCALTLRVWFLAAFAGSPLFQPVEGGHDRTIYHQAAQGPFWPEGAFEYLPLYPALLRGVYALFGSSLNAAAAFGIACDAATTALIALIALRLGARPVLAGIAGLLYAGYPLAIAYACLTMPNTLNALLLAACTLALLHLPGRRWPAWAGFGALAGLAALGWAAWLLIAAALLVYWGGQHLLRGGGAPTPAWRCMAAFALGFSLPLLPVAWHNSRVEGSFVLLTTHGGFNFYMGNHERATGHPVRVRDFRMSARALLEDAHRAAEQDSGRTLTRAESSAWWSGQGRSFWREQPGAALALTARKLMLFWNRVDVDDLRIVEQARLLAGRFTSPLWPGFALIAWLGLMGLFLAPRAGPLRVILLTGMAGLVLYFITARYRLTLAPAMLALGAAGLTAGVANLRERRWIPLLSGAVAFALVVAWPMPVRDQRAVDHYNAAVQLVQAGRLADAQRLAQAGLEIDARSADLHHVLGSALFKQERFSEAASCFAQSAALDPAHPQAAYNLALSLARTGDICGAHRALLQAAALRPLPENAQRLAGELDRLCGASGSP